MTKIKNTEDNEALFRQLVRLCRTLWYIAYRRWDRVCFYLLIARQGVEMPEPQALNEDGLKLAMNLKIPYDMIAKHIENFYADDPEFDRDFYYPADGFGTAEKVIDRDGIKQIGEQIRSDCEAVKATGGDWFTTEVLCNHCGMPSSLVPDTGHLPTVEVDGETLVRLPEFPTPPDIWNLLENNELPEHPDDYLFLRASH